MAAIKCILKKMQGLNVHMQVLLYVMAFVHVQYTVQLGRYGFNAVYLTVT